MTVAPHRSAPEFVVRTAPLWALVDKATNQLVLDAASRSRQSRAWIRTGAVVAWFLVIVLSGSSRWPWALLWVVTTGLTIPHGYRDDLRRYRTGWRRFDRFVGWLLPEYSPTPGPNPVGIADSLGCLLGGLVTGQLPVLGFLHAFRLDVPEQAIAASAAYVLATIVLIGDAAILTTHFNWMHIDVAKNPHYRRRWLALTVVVTLVILVTLWPGGSGTPGFDVRLGLDICAALGALFTCIYGRLGASRRIAATSRLVDVVKKRVRKGDALHVHNLKAAAVDVAVYLEEREARMAATYVRTLAADLQQLEEDMKNDRYVQPKSAAEIFNARLSSGGAKATWGGVLADLDPHTVKPKDAELIKLAIEGFLSNAMRQNANDLAITLTAHPIEPMGGRIVLEATCSCGALFDGSDLPEGHNLRYIKDSVSSFGGEFTVEEQASPGDIGGRHTCRLSWSTIDIPTAAVIDPAARPSAAEVPA